MGLVPLLSLKTYKHHNLVNTGWCCVDDTGGGSGYRTRSRFSDTLILHTADLPSRDLTATELQGSRIWRFWPR